MSRFDSLLYEKFRPDYPARIFREIKKFDNKIVMDLGAGTGRSAQSYLKLFPDTKITLVEPDIDMIKMAQIRLQAFESQLNWLCGWAKDFRSMDAGKYDGALVGSAWHWMSGVHYDEQIKEMLLREIKSKGWLLVFEYQFPKAVDLPDLNEWVRRQFNLQWRAKDQVPRGKLIELLSPLIKSEDFSLVARDDFDFEVDYDMDFFTGIIQSQSRFLRHQERLSDAEQTKERGEMRSQLQHFFKDREHRFTVKYTSVCLRKTH
jgi:ubiquinone/menaquinone biosynthesis C-methylase UbiE